MQGPQQEPDRPATRREGEDAMKDDGTEAYAWKTVGEDRKSRAKERKESKRGARRVASVTAGRQAERKLSPRKTAGTANGPAQTLARKREAAARVDNGDGRVVFNQLKKYLNSGAPNGYVQQTVIRLAELAKERRFLVHKRTMIEQESTVRDEQELRSRWADAAPLRQRQKYAGLQSEWEIDRKEHQARLVQLMTQWIVADKEPQREIEDRLRMFQFKTKASLSLDESMVAPTTYLDAVRPEQRQQAAPSLTTEQERLRALCLQPATPTTQLRQRTEDEVKAIVMILNHEIEVPSVPMFLIQSMGPGELACFEDIFMALEYTLYAHLEPGQRFYDNLSKAALLAQIHGGPEAAPSQKREIEDFKRDISRISLDMKTRMLKVTYKGRQTAAKWIGWMVPLATKMLPLIDYEQLRERAKTTHELVMMDYYSFVVEVRKGEVASRDMYWILAEGLGLQVQEMKHSVLPDTGVSEIQWQVRVRATECPSEILNKGYIMVGEVEVVVHHAATHVNWPCRNCFSPEHPTRCCTVKDDNTSQEQLKFTCRVGGTTPSARGSNSKSYAAKEQPRTMAHLEAVLRKEGDKLTPSTKPDRFSRRLAPVQPVSPPKREKKTSTATLTLPTEWGQTRPMEKLTVTENPEVETKGPSGKGTGLINQRDAADSPLTSRSGSSPHKTIHHPKEQGAAYSFEQDYSYKEGMGEENQAMEELEEKSFIPGAYDGAVKATKTRLRQEKLRRKQEPRGRSPTSRSTAVGAGWSPMPERDDRGSSSISNERNRPGKWYWSREAWKQERPRWF